MGKYFLVDRAPMSIFGPAVEGPVTNGGVVWLEVTYAKGSSIPNIPIEDPVF